MEELTKEEQTQFLKQSKSWRLEQWERCFLHNCVNSATFSGKNLSTLPPLVTKVCFHIVYV